MKKSVAKTLLRKYFEHNSLVASNIESFNHFIEHGLQRVVDDMEDVEPTIIPHDIDELKIKFDNIRIEKPMIVEADGSERIILPYEARLRNISYAATVLVDVSTHINGVQRESFTATIGNLPVMVKSNACHLSAMNRDKLMDEGEDPDDPGGYFIINGTERVLIEVEDLAPNRFLVEKTTLGTSPFVGKLFSTRGVLKIPHKIERASDGIFYLTFTRMTKIPFVVVLKALGLMSDADIAQAISTTENFEEVFVNLFHFEELKEQDDALDFIAKKFKTTKPREVRIEKIREYLDRFLLPHVGTDEEARADKATNLCKYLRHYLKVVKGELPLDDKDHYANKRVKMSGDLLSDLFQANLRALAKDLSFNFQRIVKRGKFPSIRVIIRDKLLTNSVYSAMATGNWVDGRKGVSQQLQRVNYLDTIAHLQRVMSPLSPSQENFAARAVHATHVGRLCPIETPEGTSIGLRKNMSLLATVSKGLAEDERAAVFASLQKMGVERK